MVVIGRWTIRLVAHSVRAEVNKSSVANRQHSIFLPSGLMEAIVQAILPTRL